MKKQLLIIALLFSQISMTMDKDSYIKNDDGSIQPKISNFLRKRNNASQPQGMEMVREEIKELTEKEREIIENRSNEMGTTCCKICAACCALGSLSCLSGAAVMILLKKLSISLGLPEHHRPYHDPMDHALRIFH